MDLCDHVLVIRTCGSDFDVVVDAADRCFPTCYTPLERVRVGRRAPCLHQCGADARAVRRREITADGGGGSSRWPVQQMAGGQ